MDDYHENLIFSADKYKFSFCAALKAAVSIYI